MGGYLIKTKKDLRTVLTSHWFALVCAVVIGVITIGPNILFIYNLNDEYQGVYIMKTDAEPYYLARIKEFYDGNGMANPFIYEYKFSEPPPISSFAEAQVAYFGMLFGMSATTAALVFSFLITTIIALLVYALSFQLIRNQFWSLTLIFLIMCGKILFDISDVFHLIRLEEVYTQFTVFARPAVPQVGIFIFLLYLNTLLIAFRENSKKWYLYLGLIFGTSFYIYFYSFTFLLALNLVLVFAFIFVGMRNKALKLFLSSFLGVVVGSYSLLQLYIITKNPFYNLLGSSLGLGSSRSLVISGGWLITIILFLVFLFFHRNEIKREHFLFFGSLLITSFIVVNQQIITGKILQEGHYHWYFNIPIFSIVIIYILYNFLKNKKTFSIVIGLLIIFSSLYATIFIQYSSYKHGYESTRENQRYMPIFLWLDENTPPEQVVFANGEITDLIPVFTNKNIVWNTASNYFLWSEERANYTQDYILKSLPERIGKYKVDYIVWDKAKDPEWNMDQYDFLRKDYTSGEIDIFTILPR